MGLSKLAKACRECPFKDTCQNKRMEAHGYLMPATMNAGMSAAAPIFRETTTINIGDGTMVEVYKDDIKRELEKIYIHHYLNLEVNMEDKKKDDNL